MFYCKKCGEKNKWPTRSVFTSHGPCEICHRTSVCFDVPSRYLPLPPTDVEVEDDAP